MERHEIIMLTFLGCAFLLEMLKRWGRKYGFEQRKQEAIEKKEPFNEKFKAESGFVTFFKCMIPIFIYWIVGAFLFRMSNIEDLAERETMVRNVSLFLGWAGYFFYNFAFFAGKDQKKFWIIAMYSILTLLAAGGFANLIS